MIHLYPLYSFSLVGKMVHNIYWCVWLFIILLHVVLASSSLLFADNGQQDDSIWLYRCMFRNIVFTNINFMKTPCGQFAYIPICLALSSARTYVGKIDC